MLKIWEKHPNLDESLKLELMQLTDQEKSEVFAEKVEFGTAGMRGIMGVGTARINVHTIQNANLGLAKYLLNKYPKDKDIKVAIGYDSRHNSKEFAHACAQVFATYGIKTLMFDQVKPTPLLSYLVRKMNAKAGIMLTASHNPKEYNGYKIYNETGAQFGLDDTNQIINYINMCENILDVEFTQDYQRFITYIGEEFDQKYLVDLDGLLLNQKFEKQAKVVFTPLHGTSQSIMPKAFKYFGFEDLICVKEQMDPNGDFPNTKSSNPEEIESYELALKYAKENNADLIIANDPDADRLGIIVKSNNDYVALSGNSTGTLLIDYLIKTRDISKNKTLYKTIVTGELGAQIARANNIKVEELLTGFKFIGEQIKLLEDANKVNEYFFGYEESYGYLIKPIARDKDAIQAALLVTEMANYYLSEYGIDLNTRLNQLYEEYGYLSEITYSITLAGIHGKEQINQVIKYVRENDISEILDAKINQKIDYALDETGLPKTEVVKFMINDGWVVFRPSGTEPKLKVYISVKGNNNQEATLKNEKIFDNIQKLITNLKRPADLF